MNINKTIGENEFTSKKFFSPIRAVVVISSDWIASCQTYETLIVGER